MLRSVSSEATSLGCGAGKTLPSDASLGGNAAGIVHDLGNLIQIATSALSIIGRQSALSGDGALLPFIERAGTSLERAAALVARTMNRTRLLDAISATAEYEATHVGRCLGEIESLIASLCEKNIHVSLVVDPFLPAIEVRPLDLQNVILNLVINARDAMPEGGLLSIGVTRSFDPRFGSGVAIAVEDTGTGMSEATLARACDPLFTTKPEGRGTGLGLATVRDFANEAGGDLDITSKLGCGTSVRLHLPSKMAPDASQRNRKD